MQRLRATVPVQKQRLGDLICPTTINVLTARLGSIRARVATAKRRGRLRRYARGNQTMPERAGNIRMSISDRGKALQELIDRCNIAYFNKGIAFCEYLETSTAKCGKPSENGKAAVLGITAFIAKPRLDYRGLFFAGGGFDFDAKETADPEGMPLKGIRDTQINFFRIAKAFNLVSFLVVYSSAHNEFYRADSKKVLLHWEIWKLNPGRRNACRIPFKNMQRLTMAEGIPLDYLQGLYSATGPRAAIDEYERERYFDRKR